MKRISTALVGLILSFIVLSTQVIGQSSVTGGPGPAPFPVSSIVGGIFGSGGDGNLVISSGTTSIGRDTAFNNLTINGTGKLNCGGYRLFVAGTLDLTTAGAGAIFGTPSGSYPPGATSSASGATAGVGTNQYTARTVPTTGASQTGKTGGTGVGTAGSNAQGASQVDFGGRGGASGAGGNGVGGGTAGGAAGASSTAPFFVNGVANPSSIQSFVVPGWSVYGALTGAIGGAGAGDGVNAGGGSGASGSGGAALYIAANILNRSGSTAASAIFAGGQQGGGGGNAAGGNAGGGGGSGGGGGGYIYMVIGSLIGSTAANMLDVSGGAGGAGGNGVGTGLGGGGGSSGYSGSINVSVLVPSAFIFVANDSVVLNAGSITGTATGGAGGAASTSQVGL